ncbi:hypothetical protein GCM10023324_64680 [Streptomyces youssoufiensis]
MDKKAVAPHPHLMCPDVRGNVIGRASPTHQCNARFGPVQRPKYRGLCPSITLRERVFGRRACAVTALFGTEATGWADVANVTVVAGNDRPCPATRPPLPEPAAAQSRMPAPGMHLQA